MSSLPSTNKKWIVPKAGGGLEQLKVIEVPMHNISDDEVLIEVRAISLNYRDVIMTLTPHYPANDNICPISDGSGVVVAVGANVKDVKVGDRVSGIFSPGFYAGKDKTSTIGLRPSLGSQIDGFAQEYVKLNAADVVKLPEYMTFEEGASLPCAGVTAWAGLHLNYGVGSNDTVLIQGTGGVSVFAGQIAKALGARVIATSSSDEKLQRLVEIGVLSSVEADGVNYKTHPEWHTEVLAKTGSKGADIIIEVGGAGSIGKSMACAAKNGEIACIGVLDQSEPQTIDYMSLFLKALQVRGVHVGSKKDFTDLVTFLEAHQIHPVVDQENSAKYSFENLPQAIADLQKGSHFGKIVISFSKKSGFFKCC
eukprot:GDKJ01000991.1.p1 GENE.GDKJ01000991.1~~GDKJ01000991.1.p1  ORF type:complete len:366 (-),score=105.32 GDKJ01000991.1:174-1271(-)